MAKELSSQEQALEFIKCKNNFLYFLHNYIHIPEVGGSSIYAPELMHPKFKRTVQCSLRFGRVVLMATRQLGKALALDTPIPLPNGEWTNMGNLKVGDTILGSNGEPIKVIKATDVMYNHDCYKIEFDCAESIIADANHLWKVDWTPMNKTKDKIVTTLELKSMVESPTAKYEQPNININLPVNNTEKDLPIHPYLLGLWLGDGSSKQANIACSTEDSIETMQNVRNCGFQTTHFKERDNTPSGYFGVYGLITLLKSNNLFGNKHIPRIYYSASIQQRLEVLQGLMDSDGYCNAKMGDCQFYQKNYSIILNVQELLFSLGIKNRVTFRIIKGEKYYTIKFTTAILPVFKLTRKLKNQNLNVSHPKNYKHYITAVTKVDSVPVRCIEVDAPDKMFLCGDFIPTHNSTISAALLEYLLNFYPRNRAIIVNMSKTAGLENIDRVRFMHDNLPAFLRSPHKNKAAERKTFLEYDNGSKIQVFFPSSATSPTTLARSLSSPILYVD